ncbi:hypothetical protein ABVT39_027117 [Epinephelus coioides]
MRLVRVNEFKTNDMQKDVYAGLHFGTTFNGARTDDMMELLDDDEEDPCSTGVIQC